MDPHADNRILDRAEAALALADGARSQSETLFLKRLLDALGVHGSAIGLSPAMVFRTIVSDRASKQDARGGLEILGMPSQIPKDALRPGDWMLRALPGTGDVGHVSVLTSASLLTPSALRSERIAAESVQPGQYGLVIEAGAFQHGRSRPFARRVLDSRGRVPPHTVLLRPRYPELTEPAGDLEEVPGLAAPPRSHTAVAGVLEQIVGADHSTVFTPPGKKDLFRRLAVAARIKIRPSAGASLAPLRAAAVKWLRQRRSDATVLHMVEERPYTAPFLLGALAADALISGRLPWLEYVGRDLSTDAEKKVSLLPAPGTRLESSGKPVKYLIISDLHRDVKSDESSHARIDHFSKNQALYCRVLDYAIGGKADMESCILIENGDAEELWAVPNLAQAPAARLKDVVAANRPVYERLNALRAQKRYFRTQGNHDSPLRDPSSLGQLEREWRPLFDARDFLIIPGIKTMDEFTVFDLLKGRKTLGEFIGLDPDYYRNKKCLIVCHGHQFDFWNSEKNELFGRIVAVLSRQPDAWMDEVLPLGGIHMQGNPLFEFEDFFSHDLNLLFNHWLERQTALSKAHQLQHLRNRDRQLRDGLMYQETLASVLVSLMMPLAKCGDGPLSRPLAERIGHQLLIGHTHYPQSQPFYPVGRVLSGLVQLLSDAVQKAAAGLDLPLPNAAAFLEGWLNAAFKSRFFNSGVSGWHEGVIYAIEITTAGQARLLYWTDRHDSPQEMDWELVPLNPKQKQRLAASKQWVADKLKEYNDALLKLRAQLPSLEDALGVFRHGMLSMLEHAAGRLSFKSILGGDGTAQMTGPDAVERLQVGLVEFLTRMARSIHANGTGELPQFEIRLPWSEQQEKKLLRVAEEMVQSGLLVGQERAAPHVAMVWMFAQEFAPYYGPFSPDRDLGAKADRGGISDRERALRALGSLLAWLPIHGGLGQKGQNAPLALTTLVWSKNAVLGVSLKVVRSPPAAGAAALVS